jgi:hypothetical protein
MKFQEYFKSKAFRITLYIIGGLVILLLVFQAGLTIGFRKANFSFGWGENYQRNFGGPRQGFFPGIRGDDFINGHGVVGTIIKVDNKAIVMKDSGGKEVIVNTNEQTSIKNGNSDVLLKDLKTDEQIVVLGVPEQDGSITAKLIRIFNNNQPPFGFMMNDQTGNNAQQLPPTPTNNLK